MESTSLRMIPRSILRRGGVYPIALAAMCFAALVLQEPAHAGESFTWTGEGNGTSWTDSCNWYEKDACQQKYPGKEATDDSATIEGLEGGPSAVTLGEDLTLASLNLSDGPTGASVTGGGLTLNQGLNWTGGDLITEVILTANNIGTISGPDFKKLDGAIHNHGNLSLDSGILHLANAAKLNNAGTFSAQKGTRIQGMVCCQTPPEVNNFGTFHVSSLFPLPGADTVTIDNASFNAAGDVAVSGGVLELRWAPGTIAAGTSFVGDGKVRVTNKAAIEMAGSFNVGPETEFELDSCSETCNRPSLTGTGTMQGGGKFLWAGGYVGTGLSGATDKLTIAEGSKMALTGQAPKQLLGTIVNRGAASFVSKAAPAPATGPLVFGTNGRFVNVATFNVGDRVAFQSGIGCCGDGSADLVNLGKLAMPKSLVPSTGSITIDSLVFENRGTVELASGTLRLGRLGGYNQLSGSTRLTGGKVESSGQLVKLVGGSLGGTGTITANVQNLAGTIAPGAPGTAGSTGILKIAGNYTHSGGSSVLKVDLKGTTPGSGFDQLQVTGQALVDWGTLDLDTATGFAPGTSTKLKVLKAGQLSGDGFTRLQDRQLPSGREWFAIYNPGDVTLGVRRV
jgi:fibronectin-binding autotransporter adhesin